MKKRIICVGNRMRSSDAAGPLVYDLLAQTRLPHDLEIIDGGLAGLNLLKYVEDAERVVFVDAITGFDRSDDLVLMDSEKASQYADFQYDHSTGLTYLLKALPYLIKEAPEVFVLGINGAPTGDKISQAAQMGLKTAINGDHP